MRGTSSGIECLELESCRRQSQVTGLYGSSGAEKRKLGPTKWSRARRSHRFVPACPRKTFAPHALRLSKPQSLVSVSHPRLDTNAYRLELVLAFQRRRCWPYFRFRQALETATSEMEHPLSNQHQPGFRYHHSTLAPAGPSSNRNHFEPTCPLPSFRDRVMSLREKTFHRLDELAAEIQSDFDSSARDEAAIEVKPNRCLAPSSRAQFLLTNSALVLCARPTVAR